MLNRLRRREIQRQEEMKLKDDAARRGVKVTSFPSERDKALVERWKKEQTKRRKDEQTRRALDRAQNNEE